ncbi:hypothetical protein, partial [Bacillus cereus]
ACILSFEENLAIKNAPPIVNYVSNNWGALHFDSLFFVVWIELYNVLQIEIIEVMRKGGGGNEISRPFSKTSAKA